MLIFSIFAQNFNKINKSIKLNFMIRRAPLKNFKLRETLNEDEQAKLLFMLTRSCREILHGAPVSSFSEVYYNCDLLCRYGHSRPLYSALYNEVMLWSKGQLANSWSQPENTNTVKGILLLWRQFEDKLAILLDAFAVLDRVYNRAENGNVSLKTVLLTAFKNSVWDSERSRLWRVVQSQMDQCLVNGMNPSEDPACNELRLFCRILERLDLFHLDENVNLIVERTVKYFNSFFNDAIRNSPNQLELPRKLVEKSHWENSFQSVAFPESIQNILSNAVKKCLIGDRLEVLCGQVLPLATLEKRDLLVCNQIYQLCMINESIGQLCFSLTDTVKKKCLQNGSISDLLDLKEYLEGELLTNGFGNNQNVAVALREGIEAAINQRTIVSSELIARHLHHLLTTAVTSVQQTRDQIAKTLSLFRLLQGKDHFEVFYKQFLAERLLRKTSIGTEFEHHSLEVMREECGAAFTSRMEGMFRDCSNSRDTQTAFQKSAAYRSRETNVQFAVNVLTNGIWPLVNQTDSITMFIPKSIKDDMMLFEQYYQKFAKKRKLKWECMLSDCTIRVPFEHSTVDIDMPAFVASVLLQFDTVDSVKLETVLKRSGLEKIWFKKAVCLLKENDIIIIKSDSIIFNSKAKFSSERVTIGQEQVRFSNPSVTHPDDDALVTKQQDREERAIRVDAAIVRFMKKRQSNINIAQLGEAVGNEDILEERVKVLVEREFLELHADNSVSYLP